MATDYGTKEKKGVEPEVGQGYGEPEKRMKAIGKHSNHKEHDKMLHKMMPKMSDCE